MADPPPNAWSELDYDPWLTLHESAAHVLKSARPSAFETAVLNYRAALFDYGEGLISWPELVRRFYEVRRVLGKWRVQVQG
jgi:hypothetical protein